MFRLSTELQELLNDFQEINPDVYDQVDFLGSINVDKDELPVMEAFENLAKARLLHLMAKDSAAALNDPIKAEKIALYLKLKDLVEKKRILTLPPVSKADELLQSARKNYHNRNGEKKLEQWLKTLPEERAIHDKKENAIRHARMALIDALCMTMKNLQPNVAGDKEHDEKENKNEKYLKLANGFLKTTGV